MSSPHRRHVLDHGVASRTRRIVRSALMRFAFGGALSVAVDAGAQGWPDPAQTSIERITSRSLDQIPAALAECASLPPASRLSIAASFVDAASSDVRAAAIRLLAGVGASDARSLLRAAFEDRVPSVRIAAVEALGADIDDTTARSLVRLLGDPDASVRSAAALALIPSALDGVDLALLPLLDDDRREVVVAACDALSARRVHAALPRIIDRVDDPSEDVARAAIAASGRFADPAALAALVAVARGARESTRLDAIDAIALHSGEVATRALLSAATAGGAPERSRAFAALVGRDDAAERARRLLDAGLLTDGVLWPRGLALDRDALDALRRVVANASKSGAPLARRVLAASGDAPAMAAMIAEATASRMPDGLVGLPSTLAVHHWAEWVDDASLGMVTSDTVAWLITWADEGTATRLLARDALPRDLAEGLVARVVEDDPERGRRLMRDRLPPRGIDAREDATRVRMLHRMGAGAVDELLVELAEQRGAAGVDVFVALGDRLDVSQVRAMGGVDALVAVLNRAPEVRASRIRALERVAFTAPEQVRSVLLRWVRDGSPRERAVALDLARSSCVVDVAEVGSRAAAAHDAWELRGLATYLRDCGSEPLPAAWADHADPVLRAVAAAHMSEAAALRASAQEAPVDVRLAARARLRHLGATPPPDVDPWIVAVDMLERGDGDAGSTSASVDEAAAVSAARRLREGRRPEEGGIESEDPLFTVVLADPATGAPAPDVLVLAMRADGTAVIQRTDASGLVVFRGAPVRALFLRAGGIVGGDAP